MNPPMRNPRSIGRVSWSEDADQTLRNMRRAGESYDACAAVLKVARSTVIDRCNVLGIRTAPDRGGLVVHRMRKLDSPAAKERGLDASLAAAAERRREREYARWRAKMGIRQGDGPPPPARIVAPPQRPIPPPKTCQWPLTDGRPWLFCDAAPGHQGASYCAEHHRAAHVQRAVVQAAQDQEGES